MLPLPPLNAVRVFEAAGRHGSFKEAAQELCVTPGAVSRHIARLEQHLGERLFERGHRLVRLTEAGRSYLTEVRRSLGALSDATETARRARSTGRLRIKAPPTFASLWLMPRLARLKSLHPGLALQIATSHEPASFETEAIDAAIGYGGDQGAGLCVDRLFGEVMVPILAPADGADLAPEQLVRRTLLHSSHRIRDWDLWCDEAGLDRVDRDRGLVLENSSFTFRGAIEGVGVALTQVAFALDEFASGRLVIPSRIALRDDVAYLLLTPHARLRDARVRHFRDWILEEARATRGRAGPFRL